MTQKTQIQKVPKPRSKLQLAQSQTNFVKYFRLHILDFHNLSSIPLSCSTLRAIREYNKAINTLRKHIDLDYKAFLATEKAEREKK